MTKEELKRAGFTIKDNGRVDFDKPPKGKIFVPLPTDKDDLENTEFDRSFVTWHKFSATPVLVKMVLIDDCELEIVNIYKAGIKKEYQKKERENRCRIESQKTGRWIMCPESNSCYKDDCPKKNGQETKKHEDTLLEDEIAEKMKNYVSLFDPTASTAVTNVMWEGFKNSLKTENSLYFKILELEEYGYTYTEIMSALKKRKKYTSWYYSQWKKIKKLWKNYYVV